MNRSDGVIRAGGAIVWRPGTREPEVVLVHRPRYDDWSFPKGKTEPGEHVLITAVREVAEETGLRVILGRPLGRTTYQTGGSLKRVSYWAARPAESAGRAAAWLGAAERGAPEPGTGVPETDDVAWLPAGQARRRLSYRRDVELLGEFLAGPAMTTPVVLLRHASAGTRSRAKIGSAAERGAADLARPLDDSGQADAKHLAELLACFGQLRVVSSAAERCLATVRPYAAAADVPVEVEPAFTAGLALTGLPEFAPDGDGQAVAVRQGKARAAELASSGVPTLICAHRENIPPLLTAACRALDASPPDGRRVRKGGFWILHTADRKLVAAQRHHLAG